MTKKQKLEFISKKVSDEELDVLINHVRQKKIHDRKLAQALKNVPSWEEFFKDAEPCTLFEDVQKKINDEAMKNPICGCMS